MGLKILATPLLFIALNMLYHNSTNCERYGQLIVAELDFFEKGAMILRLTDKEEVTDNDKNRR